MKRNILYSLEKEKRRANVLYRKMQLQKMKGIVVDKELIEKRRKEAELNEDDFRAVHEVEEALEKVKEEQNEIIEKGKEIREKEMLDYHHSEVICENDDQRKTKKKIISGIKKKLNKIYSFHYISRHVGKGEKYSIKRLHAVDKNNTIINTYMEQERIEQELSKYNEAHFKKAHDTIAYKDKIYVQLRDDQVRDKILEGRLRKEECNDERVFEFMKLLKVLIGF